MFNQTPIMLVPISGNGARPSLFGSSVVQGTGFHPTLSRGYWMGQMGTTPKDWYNRAKTSTLKFDQLLSRTSRIASKTERDAILSWVGYASTDGTPAYRYATVKSDLSDVEKFTPPAVQDYQMARRQGRIEKLEDFNKEFETKVSNAETAHGLLPEPAVIERERIVTPGAAAPAAGMDWTLPLIVGGGAVAIAVAVTLLAGGK